MLTATTVHGRRVHEVVQSESREDTNRISSVLTGCGRCLSYVDTLAGLSEGPIETVDCKRCNKRRGLTWANR